MRCLLLEDHETYREGLVRQLDAFYEVVPVGSAAELSSVPPEPEELIVADPGVDGVCALFASDWLRTARPSCRVVAHSAVDDRAFDLIQIGTGAFGSVPKTRSPGELLVALERASRGLPTLSPQQAQWVIDRWDAGVEARSVSRSVIRQLADVAEGAVIEDRDLMLELRQSAADLACPSPAQREVLALLGCGLTGTEVMHALGKTRSSVDNTMDRLSTRLRPASSVGGTWYLSRWANRVHAGCRLQGEAEHLAFFLTGAEEAAADPGSPAPEGTPPLEA